MAELGADAALLPQLLDDDDADSAIYAIEPQAGGAGQRASAGTSKPRKQKESAFLRALSPRRRK